MSTIANNKDIVLEIINLVSQLSKNKQEALIEGLKKYILMQKAIELEKSISPNNITMEDIINEIKENRDEIN